MGKTRKFIDKKTATRFTLLNRAQSDEHRNSDDHSDLVLKPILRANEDMPTHLGLDPSMVDFSRPADPDVPPFLAAARAAYAARGSGSSGADGDDLPELFDDGGGVEEFDEDDGEYYDDDEDEEHEAKAAVVPQPGIYKKGHLIGQGRIAAANSTAGKAAAAAESAERRKQRANLVFDRWGSGGIADIGLTPEEVARLPHDYDYSKHMRPRGGGSYFKAVGDVPNVDRFVEMEPPKEIDESDLDAKYGGKTLPAFDPAEVAKIVKPQFRVTREFYRAFEIEDDEELKENYEELDDDFVAKCMQDDGLGGDAGADEVNFDDEDLFAEFDDDGDDGDRASGARRGAAAASSKSKPKVTFGDNNRDEDEDENAYDDGEEDDDEFGGGKRAHPARALSKDERAAEQALQAALDEYDEDEIGDLEDDPEARGHVEDVMENFGDFIDKCLEPKKHDYNGPDLLVRREVTQAEAAEMTRKALEVLAVNDSDDAATEAKRLAEFEAALAPKPEPEFDCQSIVSTYSNLENRPKTIAVPKPGKVIRVHPQTGLPMGVSNAASAARRSATSRTVGAIAEEKAGAGDSEDEEEEDDSSFSGDGDDAVSVATVNKGQARSSKETKEERAARKAAVKAAKRAGRQRKKELRNAFKAEEVSLNASLAQQRRNNPQGVRM